MVAPADPRPAARPLIANLQLLRGIAALMIVFVHLWPLLTPLDANTQLPHAFHAGVDIFFVISGFIMVHVTTARDMSAGRFALDRIVRIVPVYWLFCLIIFAAAWLLPFLGSFRPSLGELVRSMLFIPYGSGPNFPPVIYVGWTLNLEMYFYALFTLALALTRTSGRPVPVLIAMLALPVIVAPFMPADSLLKFYGNPVVLEFAIGMLIAQHHHRLSRLPTGAGLAAVITAIALLAALPYDDEGQSRFVLFALPATLLVAGAIVLEQRGWRTEATPVLQFGAISYVLYISHPLALSAMGNVQERIAALQTPSAALAWSAFAVASAICFAWIVHHAFEQPVARGLRRRLAANRTIRASAS